MAGEGHFGDAALDELHLDPASTKPDDGACLTGHLASYKDKKNEKSCNYRWQCYVENQANSKISRRLHTYVGRFPEARRRSDFTVRNPKDWLMDYCFFVPKPEFGDWHIGGPYRDITRRSFRGREVTIAEGENFTRALWPYFNNAHHIIPKGTLKRMIAEQGEDASNIIQKALLKAKYNVNHGYNMIFLPMDKKIGSVLRLPRHLERRALQSHPVYDDYVRLKNKLNLKEEQDLVDIMNDYSQAAKDARDKQKKHKIPNAALSKAKLVQLQEDLLEIILEWGLAGTGDSLDAEGGSS